MEEVKKGAGGFLSKLHSGAGQGRLQTPAAAVSFDGMGSVRGGEGA